MGQPPTALGDSAGAGPAGVSSSGVGLVGPGPAGIGPVGVGSAGVGPAGAGLAGVGSVGAGPDGVGPADASAAGTGSPASLGAEAGPLAAQWAGAEPGHRGPGATGTGEPAAPGGPAESAEPRWAPESGGATEPRWASEPTDGDHTGAPTTGLTASVPPGLAGGGPSLSQPSPVGQPPPVAAPPPVVSDEPEIPPWDRKPLLVVIAASVVLVLIGIVSGVVTAAVAASPEAVWRDAGSAPTPDPEAEPSEGGSAAPPPAGTETITISAVGDVILGSANLGTPPNNGAGFFDDVREALAADLVTGNLDMALSDPTGYGKCDPGATDCFQLSLPPSYAGVLREGGFQLMSLANNHTQDEGPQGYANTRQALTAAGIQHTGGVDEITYTTVKGVEIAVLGFSVYSYTANLNNIPAAVELVQQAAAEADLVVIHMQGGAEGSDRTRVPPAGEHEFFFGEDRGDLRSFAHAVVDAGADVVFGHGPHVMRGMEFYQGRLIAYSLGNFCGYAVLSSAGWSGVGGILKVTLHPDGTWAGGTLIATEMVGQGSPAVDAEKRALAFVDDLSVQDFGPAAARIDHSTGAITAP